MESSFRTGIAGRRSIHNLPVSAFQPQPSWQPRCIRPHPMRSTAGLACGAPGVDAGLKVLALIEATRLTGIARNVLEYARVSRTGLGGVDVEMALALIRRGAESSWRLDAVREQAAHADVPVDLLVERHRYDQHIVEELRRLVDARRPHIIETHHTKSHCLVALSGLWRRYTWVAFHHGYTQTNIKVCAYNHVDRWSLRHAAHVITTNESFSTTLAARGVSPWRITVLHNGVREMPVVPAAVATLRRTLGLKDQERVVLAVGRLSYEKGHAHLIRAAAAWRSKARLVIVGDGPERASLERMARDLGVSDAVTLAGTTSHVAPFYALADVFVLPSLSEGSPNVLLEAMACGLPIVASRVGGVPEIAADGITALLGPPKDSDFIARAVDRLFAEPDLAARLGAAARRTVLSHHTPEQRATTLSRLYDSLVWPSIPLKNP
jgi:glycosyltransferase involved in cell wall biosynthesis